VSLQVDIYPRECLSLDKCSSMNINSKDTILAGTSPSIIRCHSSVSTKDIDSKSKAGVPRIILHDIVNSTYVQFSYNRLWYKNNDSYVLIKNYHVSLDNILVIHLQISCVPFLGVLQKIVKHAMLLSWIIYSRVIYSVPRHLQI
jgi:hypothetical protein